MISKQTCKQFNYYIDKLSEHPAAPSIIYSFNQLIWFSLQEVCINGFSSWVKKDGVSVYYTPSNYKKYKSEFDKELKEYKEDDLYKKLVRVHIPYERIYNKKWSVDHVEYWGEMSFCIFTGKDFSKYHDIKEWQCCSGPECSALSYEEMVIKSCKMFFKYYGNKLNDDFLTLEEKENHKKYHPFKFDRLTKDGKGHYMDRNKDYIEVNCAELNRRWLKWFITTPYGKKHWSNSFDEQLKDTK
jgi:hypothetical protein